MCHCACWMVFTSVVGIIFYILDVSTDFANGIIYITRGDIHWGQATLVFVFLPVAIYMFLSFVYGLLQCCSSEPENKRYSTAQRLLKVPYWQSTLVWLQPQGTTCCKRFLSYIPVLLRLEPVLSYFERIRHILRGTKDELHELERKFFQKKQIQIFIETCMESLPQIALQLYILGRKSTINGLQVVSLLLSIIGTWFIFMYIQVERKRKKKVWAIKMLWCIFGIIPTLLGSFPAISFFAAVYGPHYLFLFSVLIISFSVKWLFITTLKKYNKLSIRTLIIFIISLVKFGLLVMITLWYITVRNFDPIFLFSTLKVENPKTFIPPFIWPSPHSLLQKWALKRGDVPTPAWAACDRMKMFRNGTFVTDTRRWLSRGKGLTDNVYSFLKEDNLFCIADVADFVFCTVFYCIVLWILWDIFFYFIRCCIPSDQDAAQENQSDIEMNELQALM